MKTVRPRMQILFPCVTLILLTIGLSSLANAGIRGLGKYCGVVVFDRWDTCFLLSGPYITCISESVKNELRPYTGKAMQIDASDVFQPMNPGDTLIRKYKIIGPAPDDHRRATLDGLELEASSDFGANGSPTFLLEIRNAGSALVSIDAQQVAPVLLAPVEEKYWFLPSDGRSTAVITRSDLVHYGERQMAINGIAHSWSYTVKWEIGSAERIQLNPRQSMKCRITFRVPPGKYQFIFGFGGGVHEERSLASNSISFDLNDEGFATLAN